MSVKKSMRSLLRALAFESPTYDHDSLRVCDKAAGFLDDPKFTAAYQRGIQSGQKFGGEYNVDVHVEWRVHTLLWAAGHATKLRGDFVECGVNTGLFSLAICEYLNFNSIDKNFYLFDTFCGIPEDQGLVEETLKPSRIERMNRMYYECYEVAQRNFSDFPRAVLVRGVVPDTLSTVPIDSVCYLSIDMNIVQPEIAAIEYFWPRLTPGAPVILDDYGWEEHIAQREAMDEFASKNGTSILALPTGQGLLIKPPPS